MEDPEVVQFYDVNQDVMRPITQADVDRLVRIANAYGSLRFSIRQANDVAHHMVTGLYSRAG